MSRLLTIGSINMDLVMRVPRLPAPGETLQASGFATSRGGKGANQAVAAARLGADSAMIGCVGDDAFGAELVNGLAEEGVDVSQVSEVAGSASGIAMIHVDADGENAIAVFEGANGRCSAADAATAVGGADALLLQLEVPIETVADAIRLARATGTRVVLDPAPAPAGGISGALLETDVVTPNSSEAEAITGIAVNSREGAREAARDLRQRGARNVVVTMGEGGAFGIDDGGGEHFLGPFETEAVDTTAAGDAFNAALAVALSEGESLYAAMVFASAAGALAVSKPGAQLAMPTRSEVEALLDSHG